MWVPCGNIVRAGLEADPDDAFLLQLRDAAAAGESGQTPTLPPAPPAV